MNSYKHYCLNGRILYSYMGIHCFARAGKILDHHGYGENSYLQYHCIKGLGKIFVHIRAENNDSMLNILRKTYLLTTRDTRGDIVYAGI